MKPLGMFVGVTIWLIICFLVTEHLFTTIWGFLILESTHWSALGQAVVATWNGRWRSEWALLFTSVPGAVIVMALGAYPAALAGQKMIALTGKAVRKAGPGMKRVLMAILGGVAAIIKGTLDKRKSPPALCPEPTIATVPASVDITDNKPQPEPKIPAQQMEPLFEEPADNPGEAAPDDRPREPLQQPASLEPKTSSGNSEPSTMVPSGIVFGSTDDILNQMAEAAREEAASNQDGPVIDEGAFRAMAVMWLRENRWVPIPELGINADAGAIPFEGDSFDEDPSASIPLVIISPDQVFLSAIIDLKGEAWTASLWQTRPDNTLNWQSASGASMPCPVSALLRARSRFLLQHSLALQVADYAPDIFATPVLAFLINGTVSNPDECAALWEPAAASAITVPPVDTTDDGFLDLDPVFFHASFGSPPETDIDSHFIMNLKDGARAAA